MISRLCTSVCDLRRLLTWSPGQTQVDLVLDLCTRHILQGFATGQTGSVKHSTQPSRSTTERRYQEEAEWGHQYVFILFRDFLPPEWPHCPHVAISLRFWCGELYEESVHRSDCSLALQVGLFFWALSVYPIITVNYHKIQYFFSCRQMKKTTKK